MVKLHETTVIIQGTAYEFDGTADAEEFKKCVEAGGDPKQHADSFKCIEIYSALPTDPGSAYIPRKMRILWAAMKSRLPGND